MTGSLADGGQNDTFLAEALSERGPCPAKGTLAFKFEYKVTPFYWSAGIHQFKQYENYFQESDFITSLASDISELS
jgi:hypothetical protein